MLNFIGITDSAYLDQETFNSIIHIEGQECFYPSPEEENEETAMSRKNVEKNSGINALSNCIDPIIFKLQLFLKMYLIYNWWYNCENSVISLLYIL